MIEAWGIWCFRERHILFLFCNYSSLSQLRKQRKTNPSFPSFMGIQRFWFYIIKALNNCQPTPQIEAGEGMTT
jgi:hypothetical protein